MIWHDPVFRCDLWAKPNPPAIRLCLCVFLLTRSLSSDDNSPHKKRIRAVRFGLCLCFKAQTERKRPMGAGGLLELTTEYIHSTNGSLAVQSVLVPRESTCGR